MVDDINERLASVETKVDLVIDNVSKLSDQQQSTNKILAVQEENLRLHMEGVRLAREQNTLLKQDVDSRLQPIQEHVIQVKFLGKMMLIFVAFPAALYYVIQIIRIVSGKI